MTEIVADNPAWRGARFSEVRVRVPAKINLHLAVGTRRADGYHPLTTVFQAVDLTDDVIVRHAPAGDISVRTLGAQAHAVTDDTTNLAARAAQLLADAYQPMTGVAIEIRKTIPVAGGMAGGSADAAGALLACSILWNLGLARSQLHQLATRLGSDVPFALQGGTALGTNRGDQLEAVKSQGPFHWVLALANEGLSTPAVYRRFDELGCGSLLDPPTALMAALASGEAQSLARHIHNDLQKAACSLRPELDATLNAGLTAGALRGLVSGSGPTCAFLVTDSCDEEVSRALAAAPGVREVRHAWGPVPGARVVSVTS